MANHSRPTPRTRHMGISWFAIQAWVIEGEVTLKYKAGTVNNVDLMTKLVGWILLCRHADRSMRYLKSEVFQIAY